VSIWLWVLDDLSAFVLPWLIIIQTSENPVLISTFTLSGCILRSLQTNRIFLPFVRGFFGERAI
jgi:hypothetical protein